MTNTQLKFSVITCQINVGISPRLIWSRHSRKLSHRRFVPKSVATAVSVWWKIRNDKFGGKLCGGWAGWVWKHQLPSHHWRGSTRGSTWWHIKVYSIRRSNLHLSISRLWQVSLPSRSPFLHSNLPLFKFRLFKSQQQLKMHKRHHGTKNTNPTLDNNNEITITTRPVYCPVDGCARHKHAIHPKPLISMTALVTHFKRSHQAEERSEVFLCNRPGCGKKFFVKKDCQTHEKWWAQSQREKTNSSCCLNSLDI